MIAGVVKDWTRLGRESRVGTTSLGIVTRVRSMGVIVEE